MLSLVSLPIALLAVGIAYPLVSNILHRWAVGRFTVLNELKSLGKGTRKKREGTAVICGGSIAGLLAARVCSDHFEDVVIIDPDNDQLTASATQLLPTSVEGKADPELGHHTRSRVMQAHVIHATQVLSYWALQRMFPDFRAWAKTAGAVIGPQVFNTHRNGTFIPPPTEFYRDGIPEVFGMSRGAYEMLLRFLVMRIPCVRFVQGTVCGVHASPDQPRKIEYVDYRTGEGTKAISTLKAQLIVDCTGPSHGGLQWLRRAGFGTPEKEVYDPQIRYSGVKYTVNPTAVAKIVPYGFDDTTPWIIINFPSLDKDQRILMITQEEHNRVWVVLGGWGFKETATTTAQLRGLVRSLNQAQPVPQWVFDLFDYLEGEPEKTARRHTLSAGALHYIQYHDPVFQLPSNFVALGDAVMKLNPVFAQGMTKAMMGAVLLDAHLRRKSGQLSNTFAHGFHVDLDSKTRGSLWDGNKTIDYVIPTTKRAAGDTRGSGGAKLWYFKKLSELEVEGNRDITWRRFEITQFIAPPTTLMSPNLIIKVAWTVLVERCAGWMEKVQTARAID